MAVCPSSSASTSPAPDHTRRLQSWLAETKPIPGRMATPLHKDSSKTQYTCCFRIWSDAAETTPTPGASVLHALCAVQLQLKQTEQLTRTKPPTPPDCVCMPLVDSRAAATRPAPQCGVTAATQQLALLGHCQAQHGALMAQQLPCGLAITPQPDAPASVHSIPCAKCYELCKS
jgi:hypothetical protein